MPEKPIIACKRCKVKKLKCDDLPNTCNNCTKAAAPCLHVDSRSRREYARGYVEELQGRINYLNQILQTKMSSSRAIQSTSELPMEPVLQNTHHGGDSVVSMARLVKAAVAMDDLDPTFFDASMDLPVDFEDSSHLGTRPAILPPKETAQKLFASYLNGLHILHPFLCQSEILQELEESFSNPYHISAPALFRINMVFAIGAVSLRRAGQHNVSPINYYAAAMTSADKALGLVALEHVQALLLILLFSLQHDIGVGSKWDLAQVAMRICIENNFHKKRALNTQRMKEQMRRRVFWACYIADRHSSSVLGRPMTLQDEDISIEQPVDADDDLIISGNMDDQSLRGLSEVSAQLRQITLRRITARISTKLNQKTATQFSYQPSTSIMQEILSDLDDWRQQFPLVIRPRHAYEMIHWRDLNYFRERLKCFRIAVIMRGQIIDAENNTYFNYCQEAAMQVAFHYREIRTSEKLILNWTCVHDMMSAGFTSLYCAIAQRNAAGIERPEDVATVQGTISAVLDTLSYIAERWPMVKRHVHVFETLANRVTEHIRSRLFVPSSDGLGDLQTLPTASVDGEVPLTLDLPHPDLWDAAMAAFLDEPFDLNNIGWGVVDWDSMELLSDK